MHFERLSEDGRIWPPISHQMNSKGVTDDSIEKGGKRPLRLFDIGCC